MSWAHSQTKRVRCSWTVFRLWPPGSVLSVARIDVDRMHAWYARAITCSCPSGWLGSCCTCRACADGCCPSEPTDTSSSDRRRGLPSSPISWRALILGWASLALNSTSSTSPAKALSLLPPTPRPPLLLDCPLDGFFMKSSWEGSAVEEAPSKKSDPSGGGGGAARASAAAANSSAEEARAPPGVLVRFKKPSPVKLLPGA